MTNPTATFSRPDAEVERADIDTLMGLVETLGTVPRGGQAFRITSLAIANAAADLEHMDGLVHLGQVYNATVRQMWGACRCADGKCAITPTDADFWRPTKRDAEDRVARMIERRGRWEKDGPVPHLVTQLVARTSVEVVR